MRTLQVMSPRRTPSRSRLVNIMRASVRQVPAALERAATVWKRCEALVAPEKALDGRASRKLRTALHRPNPNHEHDQELQANLAAASGLIIASGAVDPTTSKTQITFRDFSTSNNSLAVLWRVEERASNN